MKKRAVHTKLHSDIINTVHGCWTITMIWSIVLSVYACQMRVQKNMDSKNSGHAALPTTYIWWATLLTIQYIFDYLRRADVTTIAHGRLTFNIFAPFAEFERDNYSNANTHWQY
jgi:hypothetical protein